jgi:hypothetical protein
MGERCYTIEGDHEAREKALTKWVRQAMRFIDLWDCGEDDLCELDAERLTREGYLLFGAQIEFDQWCLADLEHRSLTAFLDRPVPPLGSDVDEQAYAWAFNYEQPNGPYLEMDDLTAAFHAGYSAALNLSRGQADV